MADVIQINKNTWRIEDNGVRFFLLEGSKRALLIDSGMNTPDAKQIAETITFLPLMLLNTHADPDHISGNEAFSEFYLHPADEAQYREYYQKPFHLLPVSEGTRIDLGERSLEIIGLPGHTPGSIAILDISARVLYGGDAIQDGRIFMFGSARDLKKYIESLNRLLNSHSDSFDAVYPSHGSFPVSPDLIPKLISAAKQIQDNSALGKNVTMMGKEIKYYDFDFAGFLCDQ